jgi:hypothetical protein
VRTENAGQLRHSCPAPALTARSGEPARPPGFGSLHPHRVRRANNGWLAQSRLTAYSSVTRYFEYIFHSGGIQLYDIDHRNR